MRQHQLCNQIKTAPETVRFCHIAELIEGFVSKFFFFLFFV
jgi:hypothetical protein